MKRNKHLSFYKDCMKDGKQLPTGQSCIYHGGLCSIAHAGLISKELLDLFRPEPGVLAYWGTEYNGANLNVLAFDFSPLRQTIVLLMAAMNNEL